MHGESDVDNLVQAIIDRMADQPQPPGTAPDRRVMDQPHHVAHHDFRLVPSGNSH